MRIIGKGFAFDDLLLIPTKSTISSRFNGDIDLSVEIVPGMKLEKPIISANMDTVTGLKMANTMADLGGLGIIHRFMTIEDHKKVLKESKGYKVACVGIGSGGKKRAEELNEVSDAFLIDVAHGHSEAVIKQTEWLKKKFNKPVIAGNVATAEGTRDLINAGADSIKAGVGGGGICTTRIQTGCGVPQLTAIMNCAEVARDMGKTLIADGGIKYSGDIIKSLAAGAHTVMVGGMFAGTEEAPGQIISGVNGNMFKIYRGMASEAAQKDWKGTATSVEGEMTTLAYKGSVVGIFNSLISGMLSGMSYQNARTLNELFENAEFIEQSSAGRIESSPHGKRD